MDSEQQYRSGMTAESVRLKGSPVMQLMRGISTPLVPNKASSVSRSPVFSPSFDSPGAAPKIAGPDPQTPCARPKEIPSENVSVRSPGLLLAASGADIEVKLRTLEYEIEQCDQRSATFTALAAESTHEAALALAQDFEAYAAKVQVGAVAKALRSSNLASLRATMGAWQYVKGRGVQLARAVERRKQKLLRGSLSVWMAAAFCNMIRETMSTLLDSQCVEECITTPTGAPMEVVEVDCDLEFAAADLAGLPSDWAVLDLTPARPDAPVADVIAQECHEGFLGPQELYAEFFVEVRSTASCLRSLRTNCIWPVELLHYRGGNCCEQEEEDEDEEQEEDEQEQEEEELNSPPCRSPGTAFFRKEAAQLATEVATLQVKVAQVRKSTL
jgi:uncharacterized protein YlxW (UPF0749 family)